MQKLSKFKIEIFGIKKRKNRYIKFIAITIFISLSLFSNTLLIIIHNDPYVSEINEPNSSILFRKLCIKNFFK